MLVQYFKHVLSGAVRSDLNNASQDLAFSSLFVSDPSQGNQTVEFGPLLNSFEDVNSSQFVAIKLYVSLPGINDVLFKQLLSLSELESYNLTSLLCPLPVPAEHI